MPPRYAYWTILVDEQPTAFRAGLQEELQPTFKRLKEKHPSARMVWFQNGKIWDTRIDAQEAMRARGEMGRRGDSRQRDSGDFRKPTGGGFRDRDPSTRGGHHDSKPAARSGQVERRDPSGKLEWKPKGQKFAAEGREPSRSAQREGGLEWKPRGTPESEGGRPKDRWSKAEGHGPRRSAQREGGKPKGSFRDDSRSDKPFAREDRPFRSDDKPQWKPKPRTDFPPRSDWKPKSEWKPKPFGARAKSDWKPKSQKFAADGRESRRSPKSEGWREGGPKGDWKAESDRKPRSDWKPKGQKFAAEGREPRRSAKREGGLEWKPRGSAAPAAREKREWVPKEEYKKSQGIEAKRDKNWRPGGEHKDPRQKYKDAKKAKWGRFKANIRKTWEKKQGGRKKKDDE